MEVNENEVNRVWLKSNSVIGQPLVNLNDRKDDAVVRSPSIPREKENEPDISRVWMEEENNAVVDKEYDAVEGGDHGVQAVVRLSSR